MSVCSEAPNAGIIVIKGCESSPNEPSEINTKIISALQSNLRRRVSSKDTLTHGHRTHKRETIEKVLCVQSV